MNRLIATVACLLLAQGSEVRAQPTIVLRTKASATDEKGAVKKGAVKRGAVKKGAVKKGAVKKGAVKQRPARWRVKAPQRSTRRAASIRLDRRIAGLKREIRILRTGQDAANKRLVAQQQRLNGALDIGKGTKPRSALSSKLMRTRRRLARLNEAVAKGLDRELVEGSIVKFGARIAKLKLALTKVEGGVRSPGQTGGLLSRVDRLEGKLAALTWRRARSMAAPAPVSVLKKKKKSSWLDNVKPDVRGFLYNKLDATDGNGVSNEFGVSRAYFGAKVKLGKHFVVRLTFDAKARIKTAKSSSSTQVVEVKDAAGNVVGTTEIPKTNVSNSEGAYAAYLKYAYLEVKDLFTEGLYIRLGQAGFIGITQLEKYWTYRLQGPVLLDREKFMSSTYIGISVGYKSPSGLLAVQLSAVNGEGYSHPERQKSKDGQVALFIRPWARMSGLLHNLVVGGMGVFGRYDDAEGNDLRLRIGGVFGFAAKHYSLLQEIDYSLDPTSEAASRAKKIAGMETPLANSTAALTGGISTATYGWLDFGYFHGSLQGLRLMGRIDRADPDTSAAGNGHQRYLAGV